MKTLKRAKARLKSKIRTRIARLGKWIIASIILAIAVYFIGYGTGLLPAITRSDIVEQSRNISNNVGEWVGTLVA